MCYTGTADELNATVVGLGVGSNYLKRSAGALSVSHTEIGYIRTFVKRQHHRALWEWSWTL